MPLTVLTDDDVRDVLDSLTREDVEHMQKQLADALHNYSTAIEPEDSGCCSSNQPSRIAMKGKEGSTTLFMPATSDSGFGVKIVSISESKKDSGKPGSYFPDSSAASTYTTSSTSSNPAPLSQGHRSSTVSTTSSSSSSTNQITVPLWDPTTPMPEDSSSTTSSSEPSTTPRGSITLLTPSGQPRAIVNATTLTAFRTALASSLLFRQRASVHTVTVFGAGHQAFWHVYLSLLLRGPEIHHLHLINRSFERAQKLYMNLASCVNPAITDAFLGGKLRPSLLTPEYGEFTRLLKDHVRAADVIYCCTPSTTPLFPATHITNHGGRQKARYIAAIGSYKPHMIELAPEILRQAVRGPGNDKEHHEQKHHGMHLHQRHATEGGAVVVDSIEGAMREAGEVIKAGLGGQGLVEVGELVMLKRSHWAEKAAREERERAKREKEGKEKHHGGGHGLGHLFHHHHRSKSGSTVSSGNSEHDSKEEKERKQDKRDREKRREQEQHDGGLREWLERGNVVYKSVGIGLMDIVVGMEVVRLAEERGLGTHVPDF
ncbi:hypothetical protein FH972_021114 [Carpinus fangiana]|uniref:Quinate/shikimate 5-dehydrogenase/glutamyl-tRNA reductase domain-containing protein n=1 Tax=Carpinus fangiana TaxID=176857 RepID=A0A5N6KNZ3_9ROSI|nr:hypothetical protein FH972_021114 [Carpinus fangiana]